MTQVQKIIVEQDDADIRLDRWFKRYFPSVKNSVLQKWLRTGQIRLDGKRVKANSRIEAGQTIRIPPGADQQQDHKNEPRPLKISDADSEALLKSVFYQDDDIIALNKPAGLAVQGGTKTTLHLDAMLDHLQFDAKDRPRLVHRLDKDTSGVLLLARTRTSAKYLTGLFNTRAVQKLYWALVVGAPNSPSGLIESPLAKGQGRGGEKMIVDTDDGKPAETAFRIIDKADNNVTWLELEPKTGRTHQLRIHCASIGAPILGDGKYGGKKAFIADMPNTRKIHLHARSLILTLPNGTTKKLLAPLPADKLQTWQALGFSVETVRE